MGGKTPKASAAKKKMVRGIGPTPDETVFGI